MKNLLSACLLACALSGAASAATVWQEDFSSYTNAGITGLGATNYPAAISNWSVDVSACATLNPGSGSAGDYFMAVATSGGRMEAVNIDGEAVWSSALIDISSYTNVSLSVVASETGSSANTNKYVKLSYRLNGGTETAFALNPENIGNWSSATAVQSNLYGSTVQIIARVNNPNTGDKSIFDTVIVSGDPAASGNNPPVLDAIGNKSLTVSNALNFSVTATDADNDLITLSASNLPPGAVFNTVTNAGGVTNSFSWASAAPVGVYTTTFYAVDGMTNDFETITITVTNVSLIPVNNPPVLNVIGNKSLTVSNALNFTVTATDADNDLIMLSAQNVPSGAVFSGSSGMGSTTGQFSWVSASPTGTYSTTFYVHDGETNDFETITITVTNTPVVPLTGAVWNVMHNLPQQSSSGTDYPGQFRIRDALVSRINALQSGNTAILSTFTFSAEDGAGTVINAIDAALDRGASISFIADSDAEVFTVYGDTNSLFSLSERNTNPLNLKVENSSGGIMHDKLGLFDYGGTNQWVFVTSWNFTLAASASQWNIGLEARSPSLYSIYTNETAEFLAGRFHDDPAKSHAHDGSTFTLDGSWGTNLVRFAPYPDATQDGNNAERDITNLIAQAQSEIVFALNKLNRTPIRDALMAAANRGVIVKGVMPRSDTDPSNVSAVVYSYLTNSANYATTNTVQMLQAYSKADYSALDAGESDLIHAKYMVIDPESTNAIVIHGSANWTYEALVSNNDNDENTVFLRHNEIAGQFYEHFQRITGTGLFTEGNSTIVSWNFTDSNITADGGIAANTNSTLRRFPAPSPTNFISGALSVNGWDGGANTKYWETDFSSLQHTNIKVSSKQTSTTTGPVHFKLQYKIGTGGIYTDVTNSTVTVGTGWGGQLNRLSLPASCDNQSAVYLRWLMTSNIAVNGGSVGSSGASRIDDIIVTGTAYDLPPVLNPIGNKAVFEGLPLSFSVTASDPIDADPITLGATNLPTGAIFTNGVFSWSNAVPAGAYAVTFYATDKDGSDSKTVTITVSSIPQLFISEIADPSGSGADVFRFVELYNAGTNAINLASNNWTLARQNNGTDWTDVPLTGTVAAASTYVISKSTNFYTAYGFQPQQVSSVVDGNGNDAYVLYHGGNHTNGTLIDIYGQINVDGTNAVWNYTDSRAMRNNNILMPNPVWAASEWTITPDAATSSMTPGLHGPIPVFQGLENPFVFLGDDLSLTVTAVNTVRTDVITLSATALPGNATFAAATGTNTVSSTLNWSSPTAGVYTATLAAAGLSGTAATSIVITVASSSQMDGYFFGWKTDTIIKLRNGQFWKNTGGVGTSSFNPPLHNPVVTVTNHQMYVSGVPLSQHKSVVQMDIQENTVTNTFTGLNYHNIYQLEDGTVWRQVSTENISSNTSPVTAWRWIENGVQKMRLLARNNVVIGTCTVEASVPPADTTIHSEIDGWFRGWQNKRVFVLKNGQFWQQTSLDSSTETLYSPNITITNYLQAGFWRMSLDGQSGYVPVQRLTNVVRTAVDGSFYGFGLHNIFRLQDGSWWRQTSLDSSASENFSPDVLIYNENYTDYFELPGLGQRVEAKRLEVFTEGGISGTFRGLRYAQIYNMANGWDWAQISSESIPSDAPAPLGMVWNENGKTFLLVRDQNDRQIGTCEVIDPWADDDNDGVRNVDEAIAGTSLFDRNDLFMIILGSPGPEGRAILRWPPVSGRIYTIEWTLSLSQPFQTLETLTNWTENHWVDTITPPGSGGFYRISARLAE